MIIGTTYAGEQQDHRGGKYGACAQEYCTSNGGMHVHGV
jgi:hypothetical protein